MPAISRRGFLEQSATDVALAGFQSVGAGEFRANTLGLPIGSQTYPHEQNWDLTVQSVAYLKTLNV